MSRTSSESIAAGARTEGDFFIPGTRDNSGADEPRVRFFLQLDERCDDCRWRDTCTGDRTCWLQEKVAELDVLAHRRKERLARLGLKDGLAKGVHIVVPEQPHEAAERLLDTLGATFEVLDGEPGGLAREEGEEELRRHSGPSTSSPASPRAGVGPGKKWTEEKAIAAIQAWAREHGRPPSSKDARGNRALPSSVTCKRLGGWAYIVEKAGFPRPTKGTRYKDSSGEGAESREDAPATEEGPRSPTSSHGAPDVKEPGTEAPVAAPPLAEVAQLEEHRPTLAEGAGSKPALRFALIGVLDALAVLVDAVLPEPPE